MFAIITKQVRVIVGPAEAAVRYAQRHKLVHDEYEIVTDPQTLHRMDPPTIAEIVLLPTARHSIPKQVFREIRAEIEDLKRLWHTRVHVALS